MATVTAVLNDRYETEGKAYPIVIRVRAGNKSRELSTGFKVTEKQWNGTVVKHPDKEFINSIISEKIAAVNKYFNHCKETGRRVDLKSIDRPLTGASFTGYISSRAKSYTAEKQKTAASKASQLHKELTGLFGDLHFSDITVDIIRKYHAWMKERNHPNTIHKKLVTLRQLFTNAVNEGIFIGANPFILFKAKTVPVNKDKLTLKEIAAIEKANVKGEVAVARDIFLFSYYAKGVRFENCLFLLWKDIREGRIYITTNKGKKHISIEIHSKLKGVMDRYKGGEFVFPYIKAMPDDRTGVKGSFNAIVNQHLKVVGATAGVEISLNFHLARHSIAYHLKQQGVATSAIKDILGHSSVSITERYLKVLDDTALDREMNKVYK